MKNKNVVPRKKLTKSDLKKIKGGGSRCGLMSRGGRDCKDTVCELDTCGMERSAVHCNRKHRFNTVSIAD